MLSLRQIESKARENEAQLVFWLMIVFCFGLGLRGW